MSIVSFDNLFFFSKITFNENENWGQKKLIPGTKKFWPIKIFGKICCKFLLWDISMLSNERNCYPMKKYI